MLLAVSTIRLNNDESWMLPRVAEKIHLTERKALLLGFDESIADLLRRDGWGVVSQIFPWDLGRLSGDSASQECGDVKGEKDLVWVRNLLSLRGQSEPCFLRPLSVVRDLRIFWRNIIDNVSPSACMVSNPHVLHTGVLVEELQRRKIDYLAFERGPVKGAFELDSYGTGPHGRLTAETFRSQRLRCLEESQFSICNVSAEPSHTRPLGGHCVLGKVSNKKERRVGVIGVDDTTTGNVCKKGGFLKWGETSFDFALELAKAIDFDVVFKPHPVSAHLVAGRRLPAGVSIYIGGMDEFLNYCSAFVGLGSSADILAVLSGKNLILCGHSLFSGLGVLEEANSPSDVARLLQGNLPEPDKDIISRYLNGLIFNYFITKENFPDHCENIVGNLSWKQELSLAKKNQREAFLNNLVLKNSKTSTLCKIFEKIKSFALFGSK